MLKQYKRTDVPCLESFNDTVTFIDRTNQTLDAFEKDDARWKSIGKKLGIDLYFFRSGLIEIESLCHLLL